MLVKEYLEIKKIKEHQDITFIKAIPEKDERSPFYHCKYLTTPLMKVDEIIERKSYLLDYVILNDDQQPINWLCGANWSHWYKRGQLICMTVISIEDLQFLYPTQYKGIIETIDTHLFIKG